MKVEDRSDKEYTGRIHVDYAQARDDMHEWEKEKRVLEREQRRDRSSSPGTSTHFSESEATALLEKLKGKRPDQCFLVVPSWAWGCLATLRRILPEQVTLMLPFFVTSLSSAFRQRYVYGGVAAAVELAGQRRMQQEDGNHFLQYDSRRQRSCPPASSRSTSIRSGAARIPGEAQPKATRCHDAM